MYTDLITESKYRPIFYMFYWSSKKHFVLKDYKFIITITTESGQKLLHELGTRNFKIY